MALLRAYSGAVITIPRCAHKLLSCRTTCMSGVSGRVHGDARLRQRALRGLSHMSLVLLFCWDSPTRPRSRVFCSTRMLSTTEIGEIPCSAVGRPFTYDQNSKRFELRPGFQFHLLVTQAPCGDAAVLPDLPGQEPQGQNEQGCGAPSLAGGVKRPLPSRDVRTGAKVLRAEPCKFSRSITVANNTSAGDSDGSTRSKELHTVGQGFVGLPGAADVEAGPQAIACLRRKPGRGDPTLSMSCRCAPAHKGTEMCVWHACALDK